MTVRLAEEEGTMDQDTRTIELIDKMIDREKRYLKDANEREDTEDMAVYFHSVEILKELKRALG